MLKYKCHKVVEAFQLKEIKGLRLCGIYPDDFYDASPAFINQHTKNLIIGCYVVFYGDGYVSVSPEKSFEDGYAITPTLEEVIERIEKEPLDLDKHRKMFCDFDTEEREAVFAMLGDDYKKYQELGVIDVNGMPVPVGTTGDEEKKIIAESLAFHAEIEAKRKNGDYNEKSFLTDEYKKELGDINKCAVEDLDNAEMAEKAHDEAMREKEIEESLDDESTDDDQSDESKE